MRKTKHKLLLATNNLGKAQELAVLLECVPFVITTPQEEGITLDVEDTGANFEDKVGLKARAFATASGLFALADDSGLEVDALCEEPGPLSSGYAGPNATDGRRVRYLLGKLEGVEWDKLGARFRSVVALADPEGKVHLLERACEGVIAFEPHRLPLEEMEYTTMSGIMSKLGDRFTNL